MLVDFFDLRHEAKIVISRGSRGENCLKFNVVFRFRDNSISNHCFIIGLKCLKCLLNRRFQTSTARPRRGRMLVEYGWCAISTPEGSHVICAFGWIEKTLNFIGKYTRIHIRPLRGRNWCDRIFSTNMWPLWGRGVCAWILRFSISNPLNHAKKMIWNWKSLKP